MKKNFKKLALFGVLLIMIFGSLLCKVEVSMAGMEASRLAVVEAVADQGVFHIENTHFKTVDKIIRNNHIYSDKPVTLSWCAAQFSKVVTLLSGKNFSNSYNFMIYLMGMVFGAAVNALCFYWLFRYLCRTAKGDMRLKLMFALLCCCGTWLFSYMTIFSNHVPSALAVTGVMVCLDKYRRKQDMRAAAWAGFASGALFTLDLVAGAVFLAASPVSVWLTAPKEKRFSAAFRCAASGACIVLFSLSLNHAAYGTVLPLYMVSGGTFTPGTNDKQHLMYLLETLFTYRGLFSYQPLLLLVFPAVYCLRRKLRANDIVMLLAAAATTAIYVTITNEFGGFAYGYRYLVSIIPLLMYYTAKFVLDSKSVRLTLFAAVLGVIGLVPAFVGAYEPMCVAFEGYRSPQGHFTRTIRSTFMSNLLAWSYETAPDSYLTRKLIERYGKNDSFRYLRAQYIITKHIGTLEKLLKDSRFDLTKPVK
ncbi:MAG: hypothetical protein IKC77_02820 [Lentisphaeria bacterium]|nr:hypothetical protein [Lentisphaeria bacterium]